MPAIDTRSVHRHGIAPAAGWCRWRPYDVTADGQRFLVPTMRPADDFRVVLNWPALLPR